MRSKPLFGLTAVLLATATLPQGCRTIDRTRGRVTAEDIPFETVNQPSRIARSTAPVVETPVVETPVVETPVVETPVVETPVVETPVAVAPAPVFTAPVAERPPMDTTPFEPQLVKSAAEVGKPGSYVERVIPADGGDAPFLVEANGLTGQTGRHVSPVPPAPEPVPVVKPAPAQAGVYVVQPGDIFGRIAQKHNVSQRALREANPDVKDPNKIRVGQKLRIPAPGTGLGRRVDGPAAPAPARPKKSLPAKDGFTVYTVKPGDILGRIANAHKTTQKAILAANPSVKDPGKIRAGQQLYIPAPGAKAPAPAPKKTAAPVAVPVAAPAPAPAPAVEAAPASTPTDEFLSSLGI